ncbi:hypothetical protein FD733_19970 [Pantoea sp. Eser]|nr:hypothetical protein [Pantoea sp. Eser]
MSRRKNSGHRRVLFAGPDDVRNREIFHMAAEHAREAGMPLLWAEDEAALSEERHYYGQFCYPLVIVSPLQDGDTDDWLRILAALAYLDAGFLMFFCERPSCFPEAYFRDVFPASRHLLLPERGSPAVIRAFLTLLPDLRHRRRPAGRNAGRER